MYFQVGLPSDNVKPAIWVDGCMHAREWISPASLVYVIYTVSLLDFLSYPICCRWEIVQARWIQWLQSLFMCTDTIIKANALKGQPNQEMITYSWYAGPFWKFRLWGSFLGGKWLANQVSALYGTWDKQCRVSDSAETCFFTGQLLSV